MHSCAICMQSACKRVGSNSSTWSRAMGARNTATWTNHRTAVARPRPWPRLATGHDMETTPSYNAHHDFDIWQLSYAHAFGWPHVRSERISRTAESRRFPTRMSREVESVANGYRGAGPQTQLRADACSVVHAGSACRGARTLYASACMSA
jgi:hypothetical protein